MATAVRPKAKRTASGVAVKRMIVPFAIKADDVDESAHTFEGLASVWEQDLGNDIIHKGAFKNTIATWKKGDDAMPLLNSHNHFDIMSVFGQALDMKETSEGLWTKWEVIDGPEGDAVMRRLRPSKATKRPLIGKMSIGFMPKKFDFEQPEGSTSFWDRIRHIHEADLKEVSLVLFPMAPGAAIDVSTVKMFIEMAQNTDPAMLNVMDKKALRSLTARIGTLLKPRSPDPDDKKNTPAPTGENPTPPIVDDDTDDEDELDDDTDELVDVDVDEDVEEKGADKEIPASGEKPYLFSEALAQRLQSTMLRHRTSNIGQ